MVTTYLNKYGTAVRVMNVLYALQNKVDNIFFAEVHYIAVIVLVLLI